MTANSDGLSWTAIAVIAGMVTALCGGVWVLVTDVESGINNRLERLEADVSDLKTKMAVVIAALERIERRQIADDGKQPSPAGTTVAKPLPVSSADSVSDCTAETAAECNP